MFRNTEIARIARITALAAVVGMTGGLAGCDNDDDNGGGGGGGGGGGTNNGGKAVNFGGANGPAAAVSQALALSTFAAQVNAVTDSVGIPEAAPAEAAAKAEDSPCTKGGSLTTRPESTGTNANVPFEGGTAKQFELGGADFDDCVLSAEVANQGGMNVDTKIVIDGPITTGSADDLVFVSIGDSDSKMLNYIVDIKTSGSFNGQSFNATSKATIGQFYRLDLKSAAQSTEQQLFSIFKFTAESKGSSGGQSGSGGATGLVQYGKSLADRFKFVVDDSGFKMDGSYKYDLTTCSGEIAVKTLNPLTSSGAGISAGEIELSTGGNTLTVTYEGENLIVNKGKSDEKSFTKQQAAEAAAQNVCAGALALTPAAALGYLPR